MPKRITTYYDARMNCPSGSYSPSGEKPAAVVADWLSRDLIEVVGFGPVSDDDLALAHCPNYIRGIFAGEIANGHHNYNLDVAESTRWTVGSMVAAAVGAYTSGGITCSPSSGFHHAGFDTNRGFCTFNGLVVAARKVLDLPGVQRVGILDCDWHWGDGTSAIIDSLGMADQLRHHTSGEHCHQNVSAYFDWLESSLAALIEDDIDLLLYQAGADAHRDDPLGGQLDDNELMERDQLVFSQASSNHIPIAWNLAGGYQRDADGSIEKVLAIHRQTMLAACSVVTEGIEEFADD